MGSYELANIIAGCKRSDSKAQKELYILYSSRARKICTRYLKNPVEAEEAADDGLLKMLRGIQNFDEGKNFEPWFRQVITRAVYDYLRMKNSIQKTIVLHPDCPHFKKPNAIAKANYDDLLKLIEKLSPVYQSIFRMYHIEGYDHDEISEKLGITPATSRSNLMKARKKLMTWMNARVDKN